MMLRKFLSWCYKNADDKRELVLRKRETLRQRLLNLHVVDNELDGDFCLPQVAYPLLACK